MLKRAASAEFVGTFLLVFAGPGAMAVDAASGGAVGGVGIGLAFGAAVAGAMAAFRAISGAHINPEVTVGFLLRGERSARETGAYLLAQLGGAVAAAAAVRGIVGPAGELGASAPRIGGTDAALLSEVLLTFFLVLLVFRVGNDHLLGPLAVGGYVALAATGWGPVANASMNPARSFGPALVASAWAAHWVYWAGPLAGAGLAALADRILGPEPPPGSSATPVR